MKNPLAETVKPISSIEVDQAYPEGKSVFQSTDSFAIPNIVEKCVTV